MTPNSASAVGGAYPPRPPYPASLPSSSPATHAAVAHPARPAADYSTPHRNGTALLLLEVLLVLLAVGLVAGLWWDGRR